MNHSYLKLGQFLSRSMQLVDFFLTRYSVQVFLDLMTARQCHGMGITHFICTYWNMPVDFFMKDDR